MAKTVLKDLQLAPQKGQDLIYRNRLQSIRNEEMRSTKLQLERLVSTIEQRVSVEGKLKQALLQKDQEIKCLKQLLEEKLYVDEKKEIASQVNLMISKNEQLREAQYHLSMANATAAVTQLEEKLAKQTALYNMRETRTTVELKSSQSRIAKLQQTVRNVNLLRKKESEEHQRKSQEIAKKVTAMKDEVTKTLKQTEDYSKEVEKAREEREELLKKINNKDVLLKNARDALKQQKDYSKSLEEEIKKVMIRNQKDIELQANKFQSILEDNYHERNDSKELLQRLTKLMESKMSFITRIASSVAETKVNA
jgi:chromosome segregation ATPase